MCVYSIYTVYTVLASIGVASAYVYIPYIQYTEYLLALEWLAQVELIVRLVVTGTHTLFYCYARVPRCVVTMVTVVIMVTGANRYFHEGGVHSYVFSYPRPPSFLPYLWSCLFLVPLRPQSK